MIQQKLAFIIAFLAFCCPALAQQVLVITEKDRDGNWRDSDNQPREEYTNIRVADINSTLSISIAKDEIINRTQGQTGLPAELAQKISQLHNLLQRRNANLALIKSATESFNPVLFRQDPQLYADYIDQLQVASAEVVALMDLDPRIMPIADRLADDDNQYTRYYAAGAEVLTKMKGELDAFLQDKGLSLRVGAWLITKGENIPLHIDGFDAIAPRGSFEVERWAVFPTEEQLKQLEDLQRYARENRDADLAIIENIANNALRVMRDAVTINYQLAIDALETGLEEAMEPGAAELNPIIQDATALQQKILDLKIQLKQRAAYYQDMTGLKGADLAAFLRQTKADAEFFTTSYNSLLSDVSGLLLKIKNLPGRLTAAADKIDDALKAMAESLSQKLKMLEETLRTDIELFLQGSKLDAAALEFGAEVYRLTLSGAAHEFDLDLIKTGFRSEGDRIAFKIEVYSGPGEVPVLVEIKEVYLFKVLPHAISTVGIVFADPLNSTAIRTQFQMAPYYNLLFKGIWDKGLRRKSVAYNRLFDWGFGLHVSAPDFNKDDVPELGAGLVISGLHDYLQVGGAYNVFTGDPYWFFGIRIPMPSFGVGDN